MDPNDIPPWMRDSYERFINNDNPNLFGDEVLDEQLRKNAEHNQRLDDDHIFKPSARQNGKSRDHAPRDDTRDPFTYHFYGRQSGKSRFQSEYEGAWDYQKGGSYSTYTEYDGKPVDIRIVKDLPASYIDGGIVLKAGVTITNVDQYEMSVKEWQSLEAWAQTMPNLKVDEILENRMLWLYNVPPVITSMEI